MSNKRGQSTANKVEQEINDLENYIDKKVEEKVRVVSNKWSSMGAKQKMDFIFVAMGIVAFSLTAITHFRKLRGGGGGESPSFEGGGLAE